MAYKKVGFGAQVKVYIVTILIFQPRFGLQKGWFRGSSKSIYSNNTDISTPIWLTKRLDSGLKFKYI